MPITRRSSHVSASTSTLTEETPSSLTVAQENSTLATSKAPRKINSKKKLVPDPSDFLARNRENPWKIGAHVSAAGGVENAIVNAAMIGWVFYSVSTYVVILTSLAQTHSLSSSNPNESG